MTKPPLLHSVVELQAVPGLPPDLVDGWNCAFADEKSPSLPKLEVNPLSTLQLLVQFFEWVSYLDFGALVLCPLLGRVLPRAGLQVKNIDFLLLKLIVVKRMKSLSGQVFLQAPLSWERMV